MNSCAQKCMCTQYIHMCMYKHTLTITCRHKHICVCIYIYTRTYDILGTCTRIVLEYRYVKPCLHPSVCVGIHILCMFRYTCKFSCMFRKAQTLKTRTYQLDNGSLRLEPLLTRSMRPASCWPRRQASFGTSATGEVQAGLFCNNTRA